MFSFFSAPKSKILIRSKCRKRRLGLSEEARVKASQLVAEQLERHFTFTSDQVVAAYYAMGAELDITPVVSILLERGIDVALPVIVQSDSPLQFCLWDGKESSLVKSSYAPVLEPSLSSVSVVPDVILVPLVAFDNKGRRLGQGGGYYDRTLAGLRKSDVVADNLQIIGVGYACQEVRKLPVDETDEKLDYMVTEKRVFSFK